jgi:hypothetical protein
MYDKTKRKLPLSQKEMENVSMNKQQRDPQFTQRSQPQGFKFKALDPSPNRIRLSSPHHQTQTRQPLLPIFGTPTLKKTRPGFQFNIASDIGSRSGRSSLF